MKTKIYIPDIECDSCTKLLKHKFKNIDGIEDFTIEFDGMEISHDETISVEDIIRAVQSLGFRASTKPFERKTLKERWRDYRENPQKYHYVNKAFEYALWSFVILLVIQLVAYFGFLSTIPNFLAQYGWWLFYLDVSIATIGASLWFMYSQKGYVTCMTGMMIGMTIGMQIGMMIGLVVGAVNGYFIGAMVGMIIGTIVGMIAGSLCGVMGLLQGMMAGVMGGTMGAMVAVMMFYDRILLFMPFYMLFNVGILLGFIYMYYEEVIENRKDVQKNHIEFVTFASICIISMFILSAIMIYAPKSALFGGLV